MTADRIPLKNYFDQKVFEEEMERLFANRPIYVGSTSQLKSVGDYEVLERFGGAQFLQRSTDGIKLLDNVCSHRQAQLLTGRGNNDRIVCPLHNWTYDLGGHNLSTPRIQCDHTKMGIKNHELIEWNGLLFTGSNSLGERFNQFSAFDLKQLSNFKYSRTVSEELSYNWKHFVDMFTEDYHVPYAHPGFASVIDVNSLKRYNFDIMTTQTFDLRSSESLRKLSSSDVYKQWSRILFKAYPDQLPKFGGMTMYIYPNIMIEWDPLLLSVCTVHPTGPEKTRCLIDFYHNPAATSNFSELRDAADAAYEETATEDFELCKQLAIGRKYLYDNGREMHGPTEAKLEEGLEVFHRFYLQQMKSA